MITFLRAGGFILGLVVGAFLFSPWYECREHFIFRAAISGAAIFAVALPSFSIESLPIEMRATFIVLALFSGVLLCFECGPIHALFTVTCAYAVQHITSKLAFMAVVALGLGGSETGDIWILLLHVLANLLVCIPIFLTFTRKYLQDRAIEFNSTRTVIFSSLFLFAAIYLSSMVEKGLDQNASGYLTSYLSLNAFCAIFAISILSLEIVNCDAKLLESENLTLEALLKKDKEQYEQAREDMEKINIRYHDLKQQYSRVADEDRAGLEDEMRRLKLRYFTGNKALDVVITQKAAICEEKGIELICSADGASLAGMRSYYVYSLFGNAIDNAIECLEKVDDPSRRIIRVNVERVDEMVLIRLENYTPVEPSLENRRLVTTKPDSEAHGYGMKSISGIAEYYGGVSDFFVRDHVFFLVVALPNSRLSKVAETPLNS